MALSVPEVRRLLQAVGAAADQWARRLHWSRFRRQHQALAQRCHRRRRALQAPPVSCHPPAALPILGLPALTDATWEQLRPLLPPQKPPTGRPAVDHRLVVEGMLWVARSGASWRELPERFGPWSTVASRYQRWGKAGLWKQIVQVLLLQEPADFASTQPP
jgi:transposase